jgi:hypothetical protein
VRAVGLAVALGTACGGLAAAPASATAPVTAIAEASTTAAATQTAAARTASPTTASAEVRILAGDDGTTVLERVDTYVTHLEEDPLYSDEGAEMLYGDAYEDLRELQEKASVPTYLVFDSGLDYSTTSTVAQILAETLPDEEMVVVVAGTEGYGVQVEVVTPDQDREYLLAEQFYSIRTGTDTESVLGRVRQGLEGLEDPQPVEVTSRGGGFVQELQYQVASSPLRTFAIAMLLVVVIAAILWFAIPRGARRKRYRIPRAIAQAASAADRGAMRRALGDDALGVVERLEKLQTGSLDRETADLVEHGLDAYGLARRIADDTDAREDDLAGAMVLMGIAEAAVTRAEKAPRSGGRGSRRAAGGALSLRGNRDTTVERLCSIDPRHGPAKREIDVSVSGRTGSLTVPACAKCLHDDRGDNPLRWLTVDGRPYVLRDTVWASTLYGGTREDLVDAVVEARAKAS